MVHGEDLANALAKVKSFVPADREKEIALKANQIYIDLSPWMGNRNIQPYLETMKTAMQENRLLSFDYSDRFQNKTVRTVEPYQLILKSDHWYLQGFCRKREDFRLFRLSRISDLQIKEDTFIPRDYRKPQLDFADILLSFGENANVWSLRMSVRRSCTEYMIWRRCTSVEWCMGN